MKQLVSVREALESPKWLGGMVGANSFRVMRRAFERRGTGNLHIGDESSRAAIA
jgi:hypothetical protein